ncbi:sigma-70 family RNA polymerase sigma factor [Rhizobium jaguaris]|uniref:Sigma-70 family RNA polymerase sigma factor n=1 Tax=Rhizobium jaguaris TaxID=1312183 RepID=A0A387FUN8_9HYPH|nr:sigma-70 family RNA polymerase sigma factor [Rhizobium jaguaris]
MRAVVAFVRQSVVLFTKTCSAAAIDTVGPMLQSLHHENIGSVSPASRDLMRRFQNTVVPHLDAAYNFARFLSRDADAAQDIVQEAFLRAYRNFDGYRGGEPRAWMFAIVRNCYYVWLSEGRRKARFETSMMASEAKDDDQPHSGVDDVASEEDSPEAALIRKTESLRVRQVINSLPDLSREVLVLRELENLSYRQIADITDVPIGTVMSRLARARREFGEAWQLGEKGGVA